MIRCSLLLFAMAALSCKPSPPAQSADSVRTDTAARAGSAQQQGVRRGLPVAGLAMTDTAGRWCAAFANDSLREGERLTIIFPDTNSKSVQLRGRIERRRPNACWSAFPQHALDDHATYDVTLADSASAGDNAGLGIALLSDVRWSRGQDGVLRADVDGNGRLEEAGVCAIDEGQIFTLATRDSVSGMRHNWFRVYYDWGALVDVTCTPEGT